ncbi:MAG: CCA tRNA nucleotidyltransferase [Lawsonibacter sp.]
MDWDSRALAVIDCLERAGHRAVLVGGCVRDRLLRIEPHDYDAATSALPEEIEVACAGLRCVKTGVKHGTITVLSGGLPVEVTTFRREGTYSDHRHPDRVEFTTDLAQDLSRRDFTINAMAWGRDGLVDLFGGREDLKRRLVRCVGLPSRRFEEDALRLLRGLRLCAQLGFSTHPDTAAAIRRYAGQLSHVSWERISAEWIRLLCSPGAGRVLLEFPEVVAQILPELAPSISFDQRNPHHCYDVYTHSVKALEGVPPKAGLRLAALLHDVGKPQSFSVDDRGVGHFYGHAKVSAALADQALRRLRLDNATREKAVALVARHHLPVEPTQRWAGRWLARLGEEQFFDLLALKRGDVHACAPQEEETDVLDRAEKEARELLGRRPCLTLRDLAVNGRDAMEAGLSGQAVGRALRELLEQAAEGCVPNEREALLARLRQMGEALP